MPERKGMFVTAKNYKELPRSLRNCQHSHLKKYKLAYYVFMDQQGYCLSKLLFKYLFKRGVSATHKNLTLT